MRLASGRHNRGARAEAAALRRAPSPFRSRLLAALLLCLFLPAAASQAADVHPDSVAVDSSQSAQPDTLKRLPLILRLYDTIWFPLRYGARSLERINSTLSIPADSTRYDSTLVGHVGGQMLYATRTLYEEVLRTYELGVTAVEPERVMQLRDFFRPPESPWGWYPVVLGASSFRLKVGAKVFYRKQRVGASLDGAAAGRDMWSARGRFTLRKADEAQLRQVNLTLMQRQDDDILFYGIGPDPRTDPRSHFRASSSEENAVFNQDFKQAQAILGVRTTRFVEIRGTVILQARHIYGPWEEDNGLQQVFDVNALPGALGWQRDLYGELSYRYDNTVDQEARGVGIELFGGLDHGLNDHRRFLRYGLDARATLPILPEQFVVPRLVANVVRNLDPAIPLNFTDYPRHPTFRGIPDRILLRSDNLVLVPSLDLHHRITNRFTGRLFVEELIVAPSIDQLRLASGITAVGAALVFYTPYTDVAGIVFAYSKIGPRLTLFLGVEPNRNERSRWR